ncbi:uncharacterized protein [Pocillopora verrucosa]|uniref:uncharacterized protein n=1 Tax=Pocillopora verrucosa TaxID=203993 RepID=UPI0033404F88
MSFYSTEQTGGSAEVFRTIGEKWRNFSDSDRDAYKKVATDSGSAVSLPSADKQAKKIIGNIMKQVAELETLGGHALMLCAYDGVCYQGSAGIGDSLLKTNIMETFASRFHCELVGNRGSKMPYAKIQQLGISFNNLPLDLKKEIGVIPRKPSLYGSGQRQKLWLACHDWSFGISLPVPSMDSCTTPSATTHTSTSPTPTPSLVNSSTSC